MDLHEKIAKDFEDVFDLDGFGRASDRSVILEAFLRHEDHVSAKELADELSVTGGPSDHQFVQQVLEQLVHYGLATTIHGEGELVRFDHVHIGRHHDHIICVNCGRIVEVECPLVDRVSKISAETGFEAVHTHLQIHGICPTCVAGRPERFSLDKVATAEKVRVVAIEGGQVMRKRLTSMGLKIGSVVRRQNTNWFGPVIITSGTTRLAIGRGMSRKILVERPDGSSP